MCNPTDLNILALKGPTKVWKVREQLMPKLILWVFSSPHLIYWTSLELLLIYASTGKNQNQALRLLLILAHRKLCDPLCPKVYARVPKIVCYLWGEALNLTYHHAQIHQMNSECRFTLQKFSWYVYNVSSMELKNMCWIHLVCLRSLKVTPLK